MKATLNEILEFLQNQEPDKIFRIYLNDKKHGDLIYYTGKENIHVTQQYIEAACMRLIIANQKKIGCFDNDESNKNSFTDGYSLHNISVIRYFLYEGLSIDNIIKLEKRMRK